MARKLTEKEFITELSHRWGVTYESAKTKYYEMIDFLCDELLMYGFIDLPTFGTFRTELQQGKYIYLPVALKDDDPEKVWIDGYERIRFRASKTLKKYINKEKATKAETMRQRRIIQKQKAATDELQHQREVADNREVAMQRVKEKKKQRAKPQIDTYWENFDE